MTSNVKDATSASPFVRSPDGRYFRLSPPIGVGSCKTVYRAYDGRDGVMVAWNEVRLPEESTDEQVAAVWKEAEMLTTLKHPRILSAFACWRSPDRRRFVFLTELMTGGSLKSFVDTIPYVSLAVLKRWCRAILEGLLYLHSLPNPIAHRDLKCDNIFIHVHTGELIVGDFGLAKARDVVGHFSSMVGTPEFTAPEVYGERYQESVDVWSFGMCIIEMVSREYPYQEVEKATPFSIYRIVTSTDYLPQVLGRVMHQPLVEYIIKSLQPKPEDRPTVRQLLDDPFLQPAAGDDRVVKLARRRNSG